MKRDKILMVLLSLLALVALTGCLGSSDVHVNTDQIVGCMAACMSDTIQIVTDDGLVIPVVPGDYDEWVFK